MRKYLVTVVRTVLVTTELHIEAESIDAARQDALDVCEEDDEWIEVNESDPFVFRIDEVNV